MSGLVQLLRNRQTLTCPRYPFRIRWILKIRLAFRLLLRRQFIQMFEEIIDLFFNFFVCWIFFHTPSFC